MKFAVLLAACAACVCAQPPRALPLADMPPDTVVARSDGKPITAGEIRALLGSGDPAAVNLVKTDPERFLGSVFVMRYLATEAEKNHLPEESPLKEELQYMRDRIVANAMINRVRESFNVPDEEINAYYAKNSSRYQTAFIKAITIAFCPSIIQPKGTSTADIAQAAKDALNAAHCDAKRSEDEARAIAAKVLARAKAGEDFVKLVKEYSDDKETKDSGGDFPLVTPTSSYPAEIKNAVFALKDGEVSEPVKSGKYLYVIKIRERQVQPVDAVREPIVQELKQKHFTDWMQSISVRFKPTIERPDFFGQPAAPAKP
jgi:hypothetical protein